MKYSLSQIEEALEVFLESAKTFSLDEATAAVTEKLGENNDEIKKQLRDETKSLLEYHSEILKKEKEQNYCSKNHFFKNASFCVTPTDYEIKNGILFPGHRFAVFRDENLFSSELNLHPAKSRSKLKTKTVSISMEQAAYYHCLLGVEQMFNYFIADHGDNTEVISSGDPAANIKLNVYDLKDFYSKNNISSGDALIFTIKDRSTGSFSFTPLPSNKRNVADKKEWVRFFDEALEKIFDQHGDYLEITEQLSLAFFEGPEELLKKATVSFNEYLEMTENVQISFSGPQTVLTRRMDFEEGGHELPEELMVSRGETGSLEDILHDIGSPLMPVEVHAFLVDELMNGEGSFDNFYRRCFGNPAPDFSDEAQEAIFLNHIEDMWEKLSERKDEFEDSDKTYIRSRILQTVEDRIQWLNSIKELNINPELIPHDKMEELARESHHLSSLLGMLNTSEFSLDEDETENMIDSIENASELQEQLISEINKSLMIR